jgi:uncharacterized membrane protein YiaA
MILDATVLIKEILMKKTHPTQPSSAYILATWAVLTIALLSYLIGLWNSSFELNEKGYYFSIFLLALFASVTLQKTIRDQEEDLPVTPIFMGMCWFAFGTSIALLLIGLTNSTILLSEKGFYGIAFILALFSVITVQKNTRDLAISTQKDAHSSSYLKPEKNAHIALNKLKNND